MPRYDPMNRIPDPAGWSYFVSVFIHDEDIGGDFVVDLNTLHIWWLYVPESQRNYFTQRQRKYDRMRSRNMPESAFNQLSEDREIFGAGPDRYNRDELLAFHTTPADSSEVCPGTVATSLCPFHFPDKSGIWPVGQPFLPIPVSNPRAGHSFGFSSKSTIAQSIETTVSASSYCRFGSIADIYKRHWPYIDKIARYDVDDQPVPGPGPGGDGVWTPAIARSRLLFQEYNAAHHNGVQEPTYAQSTPPVEEHERPWFTYRHCLRFRL